MQKYESDQTFSHHDGPIQCVLKPIPDTVQSDVLQPRLFRTTISSLVQLLFVFIQSKQWYNPIIYSACFRPFQMAFKLVFGCIKNEDSPPSISDASD